MVERGIRPQELADAGLQEDVVSADSLSDLAEMLFDQYEETGTFKDLEQAIHNMRKAVDITSQQQNPAQLAARHSTLGDMLLSKYKLAGKPEDLEAAIGNAKKALDIIPQGDPNLAAMMDSLADIRYTLYERTGNPEDLDEALNLSRRVFALTPPEHPDMATVVNNLGIKLLSRYKQTGSTELLDEAVQNLQKVIDATSQGYQHLATVLSNLASMLLARHKRTGNMQDIETAKDHIKRAIETTPQNHPQLPTRLSYLGNILVTLYKRMGRSEDLELAANTMQRAADLMPSNQPDIVPILSTLGTILSDRYKQTGRTQDLEESIRVTQKAVDMLPTNHRTMPSMLNNMSNRLSDLYERSGNLENLSQSIDNIQKAVSMTPEGHPDRATRLSSFGTKLIKRYERNGDKLDLDGAISATYSGLKSTTQDSTALFSRYFNLGNMLLLRYERTGDTRDLQESISDIRKSLDLIPPDHSDQSMLLASLGVGLSAHSKRMNAPQYLNEAIEVNRQAVGMTPQLSIRFANRVMNLGADLLRRFEETGKVEDLKEAISNTQKAITCTPSDHPELSQMFNNLGTMKFVQHKQTGKIEDFDDAVNTVQKGADLTPDGHPSKIVKLNNLGTMFSWRGEKTGMTEHADKAIELYKLAFHCTTAFPLQRITAARQGIQLLVNSDRQKEANSLANKAVELFPQICSRYLDYEDQQNAVSQLAGLAADACALCLRTKGSPVRALEILEHGRGLIIGYLIDGHGDIANLNISNPEKAREFDSLRSKASLSVSPDNPPEIRLQLIRERDKAAADLEDCIRDIRQLPNQDRFLLPPATKVLMSCASEGPIVIVNITSFSSDAIIITTTEIKAINLPNIRGAEMAQYRPWSLTADTRKATLVETSSGEDRISEPFSKLWSDCVRLVLEELGLMRPSKSQEFPRIWWIGTGLASSLPFHAAGLHSAGSIENTASCVISSYIPTIKALRHAREKAAEHAIDAEHSVLLVKMPHTPGERNLSGVEAEDKTIRCVFGDSVRIRSLDRPSKNEVLENLGNFSIVHFACHGSSDSRDPSRSFLALQGESKTIPDKLTVQEMANFSMGHAWLAYLSACSTAQNKVVGLSDEVLHLASAFQVAGFAHVVATMWESKDSICSQVAGVFYGHLTKSSNKGGRDGAVAEALHAAVKEIRKQSPEEPQLWAQFIHTGA